MSTTYLRVKIKSLAEEAKMIRLEERRVNVGSRARRRMARDLATGQVRTRNGSRAEDLTDVQRARLEKRLARSRARIENGRPPEVFFGLRDHRTQDVRQEARASLLAYGFMRGVAYRRMEAEGSSKPPTERILQILNRFGNLGHNSRNQAKADLDAWMKAAA